MSHPQGTSDDFDLSRFVEAQDSGGIFEQAGIELRSGRKQSHWMWFVFPQLAGLGRSAMAQRYAIASLAEARAYLHHPVLGTRLLNCVRALLNLPGSDPIAIFGAVDAQKLRSSMTLFSRADPLQESFNDILTRYFAEEADPATIERLG